MSNHDQNDASLDGFEPYIQVLPLKIPSPIFAFALAPKLHQIKLSPKLRNLRFDREMQQVCRRFRKHRNQFPQTSWQYGKGFVYHRGPQETLVFDTNGCLVEVSRDPRPRVAGTFELVGDEGD